MLRLDVPPLLEHRIEYVSTQWLGNQLSLPIEYVSTVDMLVLQ